QDDKAVEWTPDASGVYSETFLPLFDAAGGASQAWNINAAGVIVGQDSGGAHAVVWAPNGSGGYVETVLPASGTFPATAFGISDEGLVVGEDGAGAALWTPRGGGYTETLLPLSTGSSFAIARAVRLVSSNTATAIRIAGIDSNDAVAW